MGRKCSVQDCPSDIDRPEDKGVTFHKVPLHSDVRPKWLSLCRIPDSRKKIKILFVCSRHFLRADFCSFKGNKYMLKQGVLPSVFPWDKSKLEVIRAEVRGRKQLASKKEEETSSKKEKNKKKGLGPEQDIPSTSTAANLEVPKIEIKEEIIEEESELLSNSQDVADIEIKQEPKEEIVDFDEQMRMAQTSAESAESVQAIGSSSSMDFTIDSKIEVLDNNNFWYTAKISEVDYEENEVLIHFENCLNKHDEWISMTSPRLRPIQPKSLHRFQIGERCMASWSDSRKFPATVTKICDDDTYEVLFDDGFVKNLKQRRLAKMPLGKPTQSSPLFDPIQSTKQERRDKKRKLNVAALFRKRPRLSGHEEKKPKEVKDEPIENVEENTQVVADPSISTGSEIINWHPRWEHGKPVGTESSIETIDGTRKSVIVHDPRLPVGWVKHLSQRTHGSSAGKWDTIIKSPDNRRFRSRTEIRNYLDMHSEMDVSMDCFDFSIYRNSRRRVAGSPKQKPKEPEPVVEDNPPVLEKVEEETSGFNLKVRVEDDTFKCPIEGCGKSFRRENLALMHVKHYHPEYSKYLESMPNVADLAYARTVGESLDTSPGPPKLNVNKQPSEKASTTPKTFKNDLSGCSDALPSPVRQKDLEILKILNQNTAESKELPPPPVHPDINIRDLLNKPCDLSPSDNLAIKTLCSSKPTPTIKTILPVRPATSVEETFEKSESKWPVTKQHESNKNKNVGPSILGQQPPAETVSQPGLDPSETQSISTAFDGIIIEGGKIIKLERMKQEEIINCTCGFAEEDGLMIQCELCLCWQHAYCNNIQKETEVPEKYICYICQNPYRERRSAKYLHDQEWLKQGVLPSTSFHTKDKEAMQKRFEKMKKCHDISGGLLELKEYLHTLSVKLMIAEAKNHPKLYLWSKPWNKPKLPEKCEVKEELDDCKPKLENGDHQYLKNELDSDKQDLQNKSMLMMILKGSKEEMPMLNMHNNIAPMIPQPEAPIDSIDCRLNLLDHIAHSSSLIEERLDDFEKQIEVLEEGMQTSSEENCIKTKQMLQLLLRDLDKLKQFSEAPMV